MLLLIIQIVNPQKWGERWDRDVYETPLRCTARPQVEAPLYDGDQHVSRDGAPDLRLDRVLAVARESIDAQVLPYPPKEQLDLPATLEQRVNRQSRQAGVVGQEHQHLARLGVFEADAS